MIKFTGYIICTLPSRNFTIIKKTKHSEPKKIVIQRIALGEGGVSWRTG